MRVVEVGIDIAGPYSTKLLVDLGAQVYKIERPGGDPMRSWGPALGDDAEAHSGLFEYLNAGKHGATVDLATEEGAVLARELIAGADLLVENLGPGAPQEWAELLATDSLQRINPGLVVVRISDFGQSGPLRDQVMTPLTMQAVSGWVSEREFGRAPVQAGARIPEYIGGAYAALGALTAMRIAGAAGGIVEVDVSMFESLLSTLPYPMMLAEKLKNMGLPTNTKAGPMLGIVRASDGWVGINCLTGQHWLDVCAMVGLSEFEEHQLAIMLGGPERDEFFTKVQPWLDSMTVAEIVDVCQAMRIPAAPVTDGATISQCPQYAERGFFLESGQSCSATKGFLRPGPPFRLSTTPAAVPPSPAPHLGGAPAQAWPARTASAAADTVDDAALPFAGVKVFDLSTFWAGAYLTCYLGAFGADVIKIESIQRPDAHRFSGALLRQGDDWYEQGPLWQGTNLNKRDLTLDLSSPEGRELAMRLATEADVVVENFSPRVVEHFGLDYPSLTQLNPDVLMVRMPGFGLEGPWRDYVGWALNIEQLSGMSAVTGYDDGPPCNLQGPADPIAGVHAAVALLAAMHHRSRTGEGQLIEVAQIEVGAAVTAEPVIEHSLTGATRAREGNRDRRFAQGVYAAQGESEWVAVSVRDDSDWRAVVEVIGRADLLADPRFATADARLVHHDDFDAVLSAWCATQDPDVAVEQLGSRGVPAGRLLTADRMYDVEQLAARGYYQELEHPVSGRLRYPGWPFQFSTGPTHHHRSAPPTLGQHNVEVLTAQGLSADDIESLRSRQVIGEKLLNA
ncbi:CaiB/BaiF CoA-transferase family protein [Mycobacterium sp. SMC-4]|uniref:CaiB/BaiF CoA transferase family protein n=1 Tax=Mycobacterium sp. SMC-4 TaxID=2857059 RepID=UPI0021B2EB47|nr:CoA transferase [Mycobacterium sp. SMC-4]UXA20729.1 CoA transferase [Mycobacterium sp. SMC-4]